MSSYVGARQPVGRSARGTRCPCREHLQDAEAEGEEEGDAAAAEEEVEEEDEARRGYQWYNRTGFYLPVSDGTTAGRALLSPPLAGPL